MINSTRKEKESMNDSSPSMKCTMLIQSPTKPIAPSSSDWLSPVPPGTTVIHTSVLLVESTKSKRKKNSHTVLSLFASLGMVNSSDENTQKGSFSPQSVAWNMTKILLFLRDRHSARFYALCQFQSQVASLHTHKILSIQLLESKCQFSYLWCPCFKGRWQTSVWTLVNCSTRRWVQICAWCFEFQNRINSTGKFPSVPKQHEVLLQWDLCCSAKSKDSNTKWKAPEILYCTRSYVSTWPKWRNSFPSEWKTAKRMRSVQSNCQSSSFREKRASENLDPERTCALTRIVCDWCYLVVVSSGRRRDVRFTPTLHYVWTSGVPAPLRLQICSTIVL